MFYYKNWERFCSDIRDTKIRTFRADELLSMDISNQFIILKHDVETNPIKALKLATIESNYGIYGSYYVQAYLLDSAENIAVLQRIKDLGHEVSYHYDVLDANHGDFKKAKEDFAYYLDKFNSLGFNIKTVCQHGNPVMNREGYTSNRDFFRNNEVVELYSNISDIVVNFKERTGSNYIYVSDAGYSWKLISDPENNDRQGSILDIPLKGFSGILDLIQKGNSVIISTHPHRWQKSKISILLKIIFFNFIRFAVRIARKMPFIEKALFRFYYLAKKI